MQDVVAPGDGFGPAGIGVQVGADDRQTVTDITGATLAQHGANVAFACQVADGGAGLVPGRQQLDQAMGPDEAGAARDQNLRP